MPTPEAGPEVRQLEVAVRHFADEVERLRASERYDDAEASDVLRPLCIAVVNLFKVAAYDHEIVDILTVAGDGVIDQITAWVIVEYAFRAEVATASVQQMFSEWMSCEGRDDRAALLARKSQERPVIEAEQAAILDRLVRVLNTARS